MRNACNVLLAATCLSLPMLVAGENDGELKALRTQIRAEPATEVHAAQLLGDLDRPVGEALKLAGLTIPARVGDKGQLELDLKNDGKFSAYRNDQALNLNLSREGVKQPLTVRLFLKKGPDGTWTYRNVTQLSLRIENDSFVIIDANGNGIYNEPGIDGIALKDQSYLFPLPSAEEHWCTPTQELTGLSLGPWGEDPKASGRPLATRTPGALNVLKGVIEERLKLGLTPRPEDPKLSADLQKHCAYMAANNQLTHPEDKGKPGYSPEGHEAGMRSILSMGTSAGQIAAMMVQTYFHRIDVIRPDTQAFGVGYEGKYGGIDGRTRMLAVKPSTFWPVLCPAPGQEDIALTYAKERPDATPGDERAGYPVTVQFDTGKLKLTGYKLRAVPAGLPPGAKLPDGPSIECYAFDPQTGPSNGMTAFLRCVCIIPKEPLQGGTEYEVTMEVEVDGKPWTRTWRFSTHGGRKRR